VAQSKVNSITVKSDFICIVLLMFIFIKSFHKNKGEKNTTLDIKSRLKATQRDKYNRCR